mmetsp:Transcript_6249/g.12329  ORF Transcript_6249/g.12329 Transcript_6249/m.12329 type:complete len:307 (+) Transcript_6249:494-1414(+)
MSCPECPPRSPSDAGPSSNAHKLRRKAKHARDSVSRVGDAAGVQRLVDIAIIPPLPTAPARGPHKVHDAQARRSNARSSKGRGLRSSRPRLEEEEVLDHPVVVACHAAPALLKHVLGAGLDLEVRRAAARELVVVHLPQRRRRLAHHLLLLLRCLVVERVHPAAAVVLLLLLLGRAQHVVDVESNRVLLVRMPLQFLVLEIERAHPPERAGGPGGRRRREEGSRGGGAAGGWRRIGACAALLAHAVVVVLLDSHHLVGGRGEVARLDEPAQRRVPTVLDRVVCPPRKKLGNLSPAVLKPAVRLNKQ